MHWCYEEHPHDLPATLLQHSCGEMPLEMRHELLSLKYKAHFLTFLKHPTNTLISDSWQERFPDSSQNRRQKVFNRGLCVSAVGALGLCRGAWHSKTQLIYSVLCFNLGGLGALFGGDKRPKAPRDDGTDSSTSCSFNLFTKRFTPNMFLSPIWFIPHTSPSGWSSIPK